MPPHINTFVANTYYNNITIWFVLYIVILKIGKRLVHYASEKCNKGMLQMLITAGADINVKDKVIVL